MYCGVGAKRIRELFKKARKFKPCIIFIDEIDAIGTNRCFNNNSSDTERNSTLNQLLVEMDGFIELNGVVILAATNAVKSLDKALTRPGRFDHCIKINRPN